MKQKILFKVSWVILFFITSLSIYSEVIVGAEQLDLLLPMLQDKNVALVVNQTSVVGENKTHLLDTLLSHKVKVKLIFSPEHGFRGEAEAGEQVSDAQDAKTGIPIASLYGSNRKPSLEQLAEIDVVVFDIQDVGARFYTYISTMHYVMDACAEKGIRLIVLDRPNPNDFIDGPVLQDSLKSFVGMHNIPLLHGLTVGELAGMINGEFWLGSKKCILTVVHVRGWKHGDVYELPVKPSPNLPNYQAVRLYPSLCLFEGTMVSVGRGTPFPFQVIGYPDKKYGKFLFVPYPSEGSTVQPFQSKQLCYGLDLRWKENVGGFDLSYFLDFYRISEQGEKFFARPYFFDMLAGTGLLRQQIIEGKGEAEIRASWKKELTAYKKIRSKYLLYPDTRK